MSILCLIVGHKLLNETLISFSKFKVNVRTNNFIPTSYTCQRSQYPDICFATRKILFFVPFYCFFLYFLFFLLLSPKAFFICVTCVARSLSTDKPTPDGCQIMEIVGVWLKGKITPFALTFVQKI